MKRAPSFDGALIGGRGQTNRALDSGDPEMKAASSWDEAARNHQALLTDNST